MAAHRVTKDCDASYRPETRARSKPAIPGQRRSTFDSSSHKALASHRGSARTGVRTDDDQTKFGGCPPVLTLVQYIRMRAGQAGEIPHHRARRFPGLRRHESGKRHFASTGFRSVGIDPLHTAMGLGSGDHLHRLCHVLLPPFQNANRIPVSPAPVP